MSTLPPGTKGNDFPGLSAQPQLNLAKGGSLPGTEEYQHVGGDNKKKHTPFYPIDEVNSNLHHHTPHLATRLVESPPLKRKSKDLIAFNILKRIKQLKKPPPPTLVPSKDPSPLVRGSVRFFIPIPSAQLGSPFWKSITISNRRVSPDDPVFSPWPGIICISCPNYEGMNNGSRGHFAMVYYQKRWNLVFIWRLDPAQLYGFKVCDLGQKEMSTEEFCINFSDNDVVFEFVSIYGLHQDDVNDPAFLNVHDNKLNVSTRPTSCFLPRPRFLPQRVPQPADVNVPHDNHIFTGNKRRSRCPKRSKRGGQRHSKKTKYPDWLRNKHVPCMLTVYILKDDLDSHPLTFLATFKSQSANDSVYLMPNPLKKKTPSKTPFSSMEYIVLSRDLVVLLHGKTTAEVLSLTKDCQRFSLLSFEYKDLPVRFLLCSPSQFEEAQNRTCTVSESFDGKFHYCYETSDESNNILPGVCVSVWHFQEQMASTFDTDDAQRVQDRFAHFFGSRGSIPCQAINGYIGPRYSSRPTLSPNLGPGTTYAASYQRSYYEKDYLHPYLQKKSKVLPTI